VTLRGFSHLYASASWLARFLVVRKFIYFSTGLGCPQRNIFRQTLQHAAELIVSQLTWSPSVGIHKLSDQQHVLGEHRAMRGSPSSKHDACAVVSEDTIAKAAAESHADDDGGGAARGSVPRHRRAPPSRSDPLLAMHPVVRQLVVNHAGHAIHHAEPRGHRVRYTTNWRSSG
jgi:hypothetical protein